MRLCVLGLLIAMGAVVSPAAACVGGFMHQWRDLPWGTASGPRTFSAGQLLRVLETRMGGASGTWGAAVVPGERAEEWNRRLGEGGGEESPASITWKWMGILPPFAAGTLEGQIPNGFAGMLWIDPVEIREGPVVRLDPTFPGAMALRLGWSARGVIRVMACRADGDLLLIDECALLSLFELDCLFPCALPVGGLWVRRLACQSLGGFRPDEAMLLPPFGFGQIPGEPLANQASGTGR